LIQTPNVDRFSRNATKFTDCYAGGAVCAPSRSVLMTGLHTGHTPVRANAGTVPILPEDVTIASVLQQAGYATGAFGKWALGDAGTTGAATRKGFDEFFGYLHQTHAHDYYTEYLRDGEAKYPLPGNAHGKRGQYTADVIQERALKFLRANRSKPFFLYACTTLPHGDFDPPDDRPYSDRDWPASEKNYAAMVTRADRHLGQILSLLQELKLDDQTVVFVASDNGGTGGAGRKAGDFFHSNGALRAVKGTVYEGGIRVPMLVRWPGHTKAGAVSGFPWYFADFFPTASQIAGLPAPKGLDGISVVPALEGKPQKREGGLYWEQHGYSRKTEKLTNMQQAARLGDWKGVRPKPGAALELYNLREDIGEQKNLAAEHPELARRFEEYLKAQHVEPRPHNTGNWGYGADGVPL
ncbi:MAG TPA: arylsulfatase, partial [Bryobacteraceae bacterium]|nr:arylsulfatase [Bryobacteraceae bacterium]